jgi:AAA+ ATPase superfamily predicted ATPase
MSLYLYPDELRRLFTDREEELYLLETYRQRLLEGSPFPYVSLFGTRRIGKSLLLKEFVARTLERDNLTLPVYLDLEGQCASAEGFATAYVGSICYWYLTRGQGSPWDYLEPVALPGLVAGKSQVAERIVRRLLQERQALRPDRQHLLRLAFAFPQDLAQEAGLKVIMILDEFQELEHLQNLPDTRNLLALFRSFTQSQGDVAYFLAGSAVAVMHRLMADPGSPLFVQFAQVPLAGFQPEATAALLEKLLSRPKGVPPEPQHDEVVDEIHFLTQGHPYYVTVLGERLRLGTPDRPLDRDTVRQAFVGETLSRTGRIYEFCRYIYDLSLQRARGYTALKAVLDVLATEDGLSAAEVARHLRVSHAAASEYLRWLMEVDLLVTTTEGGGRKPRKRYFYRDPVLRYWVAVATRGIEVPLSTPPVDLPALLDHLDHLYQQTATQLGLAKESQVRELLRAFAGQTVDGTLFGLAGKVTLPTFSRVEPYIAPGNAYELDALAEARTEPGGVLSPSKGRSNAERWAVEVKWRNRRADYSDLAALHTRALDLNARPWFIARTGFTPSAKKYAREKGILVSTERELQALAERLSVRFGK